MVVGRGLWVVMALMMAVSVDPTYMTRLARPGAMPMAWVMSRVCSVSSQLGLVAAAVLVPSVESKADGHVVGLVDVFEVGSQVGQVGAVILEETEVLAGAGETVRCRSRRRACRCRGRKPKGRSRWWRGRRPDPASMPWACAYSSLLTRRGSRDGVVIEAGDVPEAEGQVQCGFAIGTEEGAVLGRVLIGAHVHVEGGFNVGHGSLDLDFHAVARPADDLKAVGLCETDHSVVVILGGPNLAVNSAGVRKWRKLGLEGL